MSDIIFLRVGTGNHVSLGDFITSLRNFLQTLRNFDATVSDRLGGSIEWEVVSLEKNSPPVIGVAPMHKKRGLRDFSSVIEEQFIESTELLSTSGERHRLMSDSALLNIGRLARLVPKIGTLAVYIDGTGEIKAQAEITEKTLNSVEQLTRVKYRAYGSIVGNLDSINVHTGNEFRVWDERTKKPVRCRFDEKDLERVKGLLKSRVIVYGKLQSNSAGHPISISADELGTRPKRKLPTIEEMSGLVEDFTEGLSLKDYMEMLSNE